MPNEVPPRYATTSRAQKFSLRWLNQCQYLVLVVVLLLAAPDVVRAQLTVTGGIERFSWEEFTSPPVEESGPLLAFGIGYTQRAEKGFLLAYRGKLWTGEVDYSGSTLFGNTPVTSTTAYLGMHNEVQARHRQQLNDTYRQDFLAGLGLALWRRELSQVQKEEYQVIYARAGFEIDSVSPKTWMFGFGLSYPMWVREDAHLTSIGFDRNPTLEPGGKMSIFGHIGYRFTNQWNVVGYVDGFRFEESDKETVNEVARGIGQVNVFQPASDMLVVGVRFERVFP